MPLFLTRPAILSSLEHQLDAGIAALGLTLPGEATTRLLAYLRLLERWNAHYNLTAVREPAQMVTRHLLDSLAVAPHVDGDTLADLGAGAGLPGIPLAIAAPQRAVTLIDANGKKARFMRTARRELALDNVSVVEARVEQAEGRFDCIVARAFASLPRMLALGGHLLAPGGRWLALKGRLPEDEIAALPAGFRIDGTVSLSVPGLNAERHLLVMSKAPTQ
ncbi:MAG TPA: 16S rRNA (guanine(527)-N(7))-methyltransferase RsmG [Rhodanobacteraceae bacterium]|nr:16S rRNA (guanine(527)-N(7))-methyltransferase RsmG [Rhodanobacteraceae bacterium]